MIQEIYNLGLYQKDVSKQFVTTTSMYSVSFGRNRLPVPYEGPVYKLKMVDVGCNTGLINEYWVLAPERETPLCPIMVKPIKRDQPVVGGIFLDQINSILNQDCFFHPITELVLSELEQMGQEIGTSAANFIQNGFVYNAVLNQRQIGLSPISYYTVLFILSWLETVSVCQCNDNVMHKLGAYEHLDSIWRKTQDISFESVIAVDVPSNDIVLRFMARGIETLEEVFKHVASRNCKMLPTGMGHQIPNLRYSAIQGEEHIVYSDRFVCFIHAISLAAIMAPYDWFELVLKDGIIKYINVDSMLYYSYKNKFVEENYLTTIFDNVITSFLPNEIHRYGINLHIIKTPQEILKISIWQEEEVFTAVIDLFTSVMYGFGNVCLMDWDINRTSFLF